MTRIKRDVSSVGSFPAVAALPGAVQGLGRGRYDGSTFRPMTHKKAAIARAIAVTTTGGFLPAARRQ